MGDRRPDSLVISHADSAQILEIPLLTVPERLCWTLWGRDEKAGEIFPSGNCSLSAENGKTFPGFSLMAMKHPSKDLHSQ
jgi:hypothetical protein